MKNLSKNQKILIILFIVATIFVVAITVYFTHNLITSTIPLLKEYGDSHQSLGSQLTAALVFNIVYQVVLLFLYFVGLWLGISKFKKENSKQQ